MGFESVEGYQRAFYRGFGSNPNAYAKHPIPLSLFIPHGVKFKKPKRRAKDMERAKTVFIQAIEDVQQAMDHYDPTLIGFNWDNSQPRIQLEPIGKRGYIEMRAIH